jgi:hypothetical protein
VDAPTSIDRPRRCDIAAAYIFSECTPNEIAIVIDSEGFERAIHTRGSGIWSAAKAS